jgi:hypothetical protein
LELAQRAFLDTANFCLCGLFGITVLLLLLPDPIRNLDGKSIEDEMEKEVWR